ncbi:MAG: hypothetical protein P8179_01125 [Candidatus Thiodiazotropha sp.]
MFDYDENRFDDYSHLLGESRYSVNGTLVAAHGGVTTPWNSTLFRLVAPCPAPPQAHPSCCPTDLFRFNIEDGHDSIREQSGNDQLVFGTDIEAESIALR